MDSRSGRPSYHHHAGYYRTINTGDDLSKPWEGTPFSDFDLPLSPLRPVFDIPKATPIIRASDSSSSTFVAVSLVKVQVNKNGFWARVRRFLRLGKFSKEHEDIVSSFEAAVPEPIVSSKVEPHEWKQYGYWARPFLNNVMACNSPVASEKSITTSELQHVLHNIRGPNDTPHPEAWIRGAKHPSLPPRPHRWDPPNPAEPLPFPWEVQLNPLLQHPIWGPAPLAWCLHRNPLIPNTLRYGRTHQAPFCEPPDFAQPATWPFLTHMHLNAVAGDTAPTFPWPFTVHNERGIQVGDVLREIWVCFNEPVKEDERMSWPVGRQEAAERARWARCRMEEGVNRVPETAVFGMRGELVQAGLAPNGVWVDVMRRCDALGGLMWFRGIEPTIDGGGWMITFGTH